MTSPEGPVSIQDILLENKEAVLYTRELFRIHTPLDRGEERIVIGNFADLTEGGGMSREEYRALFEQCAQKKDFTDLAFKYADFSEGRYRKFLQDHPDLPENGDDLHPGRRNIEGALGGIRGHRQGLKDRKNHLGNNPLCNIGSPSIRLTPYWVVAVKQSGMRMREIFDFLEKKGEANTQTMTAPDNIQGETRHEIQDDIE